MGVLKMEIAIELISVLSGFITTLFAFKKVLNEENRKFVFKREYNPDRLYSFIKFTVINIWVLWLLAQLPYCENELLRFIVKFIICFIGVILIVVSHIKNHFEIRRNIFGYFVLNTICLYMSWIYIVDCKKELILFILYHFLIMYFGSLKGLHYTYIRLFLNDGNTIKTTNDKFCIEKDYYCYCIKQNGIFEERRIPKENVKCLVCGLIDETK